MYYDPDGYDVLPFYHNYTPAGDWVYTGYFIPSYIGAVTEYGIDANGVQRKLLDNRGYCYWENYKKQLDLDREKLIHNPKALIDLQAEYCYNAEEAFALEGENKFNKVLIAEQLTKIRALKQCPYIENGFIEYIYKNNQHLQSNITGFRWIPNQSGKIQILEHPIWTLPPIKDENGNTIPTPEKMKGLYVIGVDGIDIGKSQTSEATKDPSDFCLVIMKRAYGNYGPKIVAMYKDRPNDVRDAYKITLKLAQYYNAIINIEATRMGLVTWARDQKQLSYFMKRPRATLTDIQRGNSKQYGTPATAAIINHQTDLIAEFVTDYYYEMWFAEMLDQLLQYSDEKKTKFDIVAALGMCCLADEEMSGIVPKNVEVKNDDWQDIGYYTDEKGIKRFGIIPNQTQIKISYNWNNVDLGIRSSDPRLYEGYI